MYNEHTFSAILIIVCILLTVECSCMLHGGPWRHISLYGFTAAAEYKVTLNRQTQHTTVHSDFTPRALFVFFPVLERLWCVVGDDLDQDDRVDEEEHQASQPHKPKRAETLELQAVGRHEP